MHASVTDQARTLDRGIGAAGGNLADRPETLLRRLRDDPFDIVEVQPAGAGVMGAEKLTLSFRSDGSRIAAKWKRAPRGGEGWNNSPRREIGAYAVQRLFLDPHDYVVPPVAARCIPPDVYRPIEADPTPNLPGTCGVFGALAAWLDDVTTPKAAFDPERFRRDVRYAYYFANVNLLAYLIDHRDARASNYALSTDPDNPQLFSIDNGIAFGGVLYNFFTWHFDKIRVGGLPAGSIQRLRRVTSRDLASLGVLGEWRRDAAGILRHVAAGPNVAPDRGVRVTPDGMQLGLTSKEIGAIAVRLHDLLGRIDRRELLTFTDSPPSARPHWFAAVPP